MVVCVCVGGGGAQQYGGGCGWRAWVVVGRGGARSSICWWRVCLILHIDMMAACLWRVWVGGWRRVVAALIGMLAARFSIIGMLGRFLLAGGGGKSGVVWGGGMRSSVMMAALR